MSSFEVDELKVIVCLVAATYASYQALQLLRQDEKRNTARKKRRMTPPEKSRNNEGVSSIKQEYDNPIETKNILEEKKIVPNPQTTSSVEQIQITNPRSLKRKKKKSGNFVESITSKFSDKQFKTHFRVSRKTADKLHECFKSSEEYTNILILDDKSKVPSNYFILMFLWFAGKGCSYQELSRVFNVPLSRSICIVDVVIQFLNNCATDYIRFPDEPVEKRASAERFQEIAGFPDVIGGLVSTYLQAQGTLSSHENLTSTVQAVCDFKGRFLDVFVEALHKVHHTELIQASEINEKLKKICQGRFHILTEGDYNIREWLLTPYKEPFSDGQHLYNKNLRSTLKQVSDALVLLKARFQQLTAVSSFSSYSYSVQKLIIACCVVQNICLDNDDYYVDIDPLAINSSVDNEEAIVENDVISDDTHLRRIGELKRKRIMEDFQMI